MNRQNQIKLLVSVILFGVSVVMFSLAIQRYQVLTSSRASGSFAQCNGTGSNQPCGSCNVTDISINSSGQGTVTYGCQLLCDQIDPSSCPVGTYAVNDSSWFWCSDASGSSCTQASSDVKGNVHNTSTLESFDINASNRNVTKNGLTWTFSIPNWNGCGRVQADIQINAPGISVAGLTKPFGSNCDQPQPTTPPQNTPVPTTPPQNTPVPTTPQNTPAPTTPPNTPVPTTPQDTPVPTTPPNTPVPTDTPVPPTNTPTLTYTPVPPTVTHTPIPPTPTNTFTPAPTFTLAPTFTPQPTYPPQATYTPQPTQLAQVQPTNPPPPQNLTVNEQPPGITPWLLVLVPIGLILIGLLF